MGEETSTGCGLARSRLPATPQGQGMRRASHDRRQPSRQSHTSRRQSNGSRETGCCFLNLQIGMNVKRAQPNRDVGLPGRPRGVGDYLGEARGSCVVLLLMEEGEAAAMCRWAPGPCPWTGNRCGSVPTRWQWPQDTGNPGGQRTRTQSQVNGCFLEILPSQTPAHEPGVSSLLPSD